jgi:hypothetical protein
MFSSVKLAASAILATMLATAMVSASPIVEQRDPTCKPSFDGKRQTIFYNPNLSRKVIAWTANAVKGTPITLMVQDTEQPPTLQQGEFLVPVGGVGAHSYEFK